MYVGTAKFETSRDVASQELVTGMTLPITPQQLSMASPQWAHPEEEKAFDLERSQLIVGQSTQCSSVCIMVNQ